MLLVHEVSSHLALQPLGLLFTLPAPGAALDFFGPLMLVAAHDAVVNHDQATAAPQKFLKARALFADDFHAILGVNHEHVGVLQLLARRKIHRTVGLCAALVEHFLPFREEARMIVLIRAVGLGAGANKHPERLVRPGGVGTKANEQ